MSSSARPGSVTFINRFTLSCDPEQFEKAFDEVARFMTEQPGIISYTLSQGTETVDHYVNVAVWRDTDSLRNAVAHPEFRTHVQALRSLATSDSELFAERLAFRSQDAAAR